MCCRKHIPQKTLLLIFSFLVFNSSFLIATVRYVSHSGNNTPPYTSWATAADSIMSAINISLFGDTIYVANGVYEEQVVMIPGLSLIGAGMDSCVIDTRQLVSSQGFIAVEVADSCTFAGFHIIVYNNSLWGYAIGASIGNSTSTIYHNKVTKGRYGFYVSNLDTSNHSEISVYKNVFNNVSQGIHIFNSNTVASGNVIQLDPNSQAVIRAGVDIEAFFFTYTPVIDSNYIEANNGSGINKGFGAKPIISNNIIKLNSLGATGISLSVSDSAWVYNNLIISKIGATDGIYNSGVQYLQLYNNYITGNFRYYVLLLGPENLVKNNAIIKVDGNIRKWGSGNLVYQYNNVWNSEVEYVDFTPDSTNLSVDPMVVNDDSTQGELDFHLQMFSPLIDTGDPNILDKDGTRSDVGLYGGHLGESYTYLDLAPRPPVNLTAEVESDSITVSWNHNTEADFSFYSLFRDTASNFTADSTTFILSITDTSYTHIIPAGVESFYYKLTATDNQGNQSSPSEELAVLLTSINKHPITVNNYKLYQNYPNPFNPSTKIGYRLQERGYVKLYVYDIKGELIEVLVNKIQETGYYEVEFSASGVNASSLASGVYIYQVHVISENNIPVFSDLKKMILLK